MSEPESPDVPGDEDPQPRRRRRAPGRVAAVGGAVVVVLAIGSGVLWMSERGSGRDSPSAGEAWSAPATSVPDAAGLDDIAASAPCGRVASATQLAGVDTVAAFPAVAVVNCRTDVKSYAGEGEWVVLVRQVTVDGLPQLMSALTRPDEQASSGDTACAAVGYGPLTILLAGRSGAYLHPRAPATACGAPQPAVLAAVNGLTWRTVSVSRIEQTRTEASITSGCDMGWKNETAIDAANASDSAGGPVFTTDAETPLRVCIYRVADDDPQVGAFERGLTLDGSDSRRLRDALTGPGPGGGCAVQDTFAVIRAAGQWVTLELGGCWRLVREIDNPATYGSADADVVKELLGLS